MCIRDRRYIQRGNCVVLQPFNPAYSEMVIKGEDLNLSLIHI